MNFEKLLWISNRKMWLQHHGAGHRNHRHLKKSIIFTPKHGGAEQSEGK